MINTTRYKGLIMGICFALVSISCIASFVLPVMILLPVFFLESALAKFFPDISGFERDVVMTVFLVLLICVLCWLIFINIDKRLKRQYEISNFVLAIYLLVVAIPVHSFGFYAFFELFHTPKEEEGFGYAFSFPISSLMLVLFGVLIDWKRNSIRRKLSDESNETLA